MTSPSTITVAGIVLRLIPGEEAYESVRKLGEFCARVERTNTTTWFAGIAFQGEEFWSTTGSLDEVKKALARRLRALKRALSKVTP